MFSIGLVPRISGRSTPQIPSAIPLARKPIHHVHQERKFPPLQPRKLCVPVTRYPRNKMSCPVPCTGVDDNAQANLSAHPPHPLHCGVRPVALIYIICSTWSLLSGVSSTAVTLVAKANEAAMHRFGILPKLKVYRMLTSLYFTENSQRRRI